MKQLFSTAILFSSVLLAFAETQTCDIQTTAICGDCKVRIEKRLAFEKGVKSSTLDLSSKILHVSFNNKKTNCDKIKHAITDVGYDADELKANTEAYNKLPACCQSGPSH